MRNQRLLEFIVGIFMILGFLALVFLALQVSGLTQLWRTQSYTVKATFGNIGGLKEHAQVTIAGVKVGYVKTIKLDPNSFRATVVLDINEGTKIPEDTSASIYTEGLLGSNYISLSPGFAENNLKSGQVINDTHSAMVLENLIGQLMYNIGGKKHAKTSS
jgi:phospholipid/cholesterol/gamma-HCH transport system substrate-binding protein